MPNSNALFGFGNLSDPQDPDGHFPGRAPVFLDSVGLWQPSSPLQNLQNRFLSVKARTPNCVRDSSCFAIDLGQTQAILAVVIPRHNLTLSAVMTVSLYADAQLTNLVASQSRQVATTYSWGALQFGDPSWFTGVIDQERARFVPQPAMVLFPSPQFARYVLVQIDDTGNQDGYIELSRLFVTPGYQPSINIKYGSSAGVNDPTVSTRSPGGADFYDIRPKHRIITCQIDYLPKGEAFATHFMAQLRLGLSGQFFFSKFPSDQTLFALTSFIATLTKLDPITSACFGYQNAAYAIEEVVA